MCLKGRLDLIAHLLALGRRGSTFVSMEHVNLKSLISEGHNQSSASQRRERDVKQHRITLTSDKAAVCLLCEGRLESKAGHI